VTAAIRGFITMIGLVCVSGAASAAAEIIDSKVWATGVSAAVPMWIDARRVLFLTGADLKLNERVRSLAEWDVNGGVKLYKSHINDFCHRDGSVVYKVLDPDDPRLIRGTWYGGRLGQERKLREDTEGDSARLHDLINCEIATLSELTKASQSSERKIFALREGHGRLEFGPSRGPDSTKNARVRWLSPPPERAVVMPFGRFDVLPPSTYYAFAGAYVFRNLAYGRRNSAATEMIAAWVLRTDGSVSKLVIPTGPWSGGASLAPYPTAKGLVFVSTAVGKGGEGIYLVDEQKPRRLLAGHVAAVGVSPDGCLLAFSSAPSADRDRADPANRRTLKAVDLCGR
jgi:hypothetical protein